MKFFHNFLDFFFYTLIAITLLSIAHFYESFQLTQNYQSIKKWPKTRGTVLGNGQYRYRVNERNYFSERASFQTFTIIPWKTPKLESKGKEVLVYYSPKEPSLSLLTTQLIPLYLRLLISPALMVICFLGWKSKKRAFTSSNAKS